MPTRPLVAAGPLPTFGRAAALRPPAPAFSLVVDLAGEPLSWRWWRGAATLIALCLGISTLAPSLDPLPPPPLVDVDPERLVQERALAIAPLGSGSRTGLAMGETARVRPIVAAPQRSLRDLTLVTAAGEDLAAALRRVGASPVVAARAAALARAESATPLAGTTLHLRLGAPASDGTRPIARLSYRARLDLDLTLAATPEGGLAAIRTPLSIDRTPLRIRGVVGGGLYWALRSAGATPEIAAGYLQAIGATIDVGSEVAAGDRFELVVARARSANGEAVSGALLYAGLDRAAAPDLSLVRWPVAPNGRWIDTAATPAPVQSALARPVNAPVTSGFGMRVHPILRFARMHRGLDFGAGWGTPIVAAADGQVVRAGWAGGYGRQVRIAHEGSLLTSYSHMSRIVVPEGGGVRRGELIGYVGSSGLSTGPHLHYEVWRGGVAVDPGSVTIIPRAAVDDRMMAALRARAKALRGG